MELRLKSIWFSLIIICLSQLTFITNATDIKPNTVNSTSSETKSIKPLKISIPADRAPFAKILSNGKAIGLYVEFWQLWSKHSKHPIEFMATEFSQYKEDMQNKVFDIRSGMFRNTKRDSWTDHSIPYHHIETKLYSLSSTTEKITLDTLSKSANDTVAVVRGSFQQDYIQNHYPNINLVFFDNIEEAIDYLINHEITAIVSEAPYMDSKISSSRLQGLISKSNKVIFKNTVHALVLKDNNELIKIINDGIKLIPVGEIIEIEKRWLPDTTPFFETKKTLSPFTSEQLEWLNQLGELKLGIDQDTPPYDFIDSKNNHVGLVADYIKIIEEQLGIKIVAQTQYSWLAGYEKTKIGEFDLVSSVVKSAGREKVINFTKPYITFPSVIATYKDSIYIENMDSLNDLRVGLEKGLIYEELITKKHPKYNVVSFSSTKEGLEALQDEKIDAFIGPLPMINNEVSKNKFNHVAIAAFTPYDLELSIGVRRGLERLIPMINLVLESISIKQRTKMANEWISAGNNKELLLKDFIIQIAPLFAFLLLIIIYIIRSNNKLKFEVSEKEKIEKRLEQEKQNAEKANKSKDEFLANMSHEIRTPMNAVVGMSELLSYTPLDIEQQKYNNVIQSSAASLLVIINDILDISKMEAGELRLEQRPFNLLELIKKIQAQIQFLLDETKLRFTFKLEKGIPEIILGDEIRLGQIILNLLNNAIKFTSKGEIRLSVRPIPDTQKCGLEFLVSDTGKGISKEELKKLFVNYGQADSSITRKYGGTGLGLSISKKLCELMDGHIWVESMVGFGSEFHFTCFFPNKVEAVNKISNTSLKDVGINKASINKQVAEHSSLTNIHILLVDDNQTNLLIASKILKLYGAEVMTAENGSVAIEKIKNNIFDLVLMDIQMPVMDGYDATSYIRNVLKDHHLPIIAVTAHVMPEDIKKALDSGMNAHIEKPINKQKMLDVVLEQLIKK